MENETARRSKEKLFECDICNRFYTTPVTLKVHRAQHTAPKSELCDTCGARFKTRGQLKIHQRVHTGEKPFKCDKCDKAFAYRESLITHTTTHTNVKPFVCAACDAQFSCIGNLLKHRKARPNTCGLPSVPIKRVGTRLNRNTFPPLSNKASKHIEHEEGSRSPVATGPDEVETLECFEMTEKCIRLSVEALQTPPKVFDTVESSIESEAEVHCMEEIALNETNETIQPENERQNIAVSEETNPLVELIATGENAQTSVYRITFVDDSESVPLKAISEGNESENLLEDSIDTNDERDDESWRGESDHSSNNETTESPKNSSKPQKRHYSQELLSLIAELRMEQPDSETDKQERELCEEQLVLLHDLSHYIDGRYRCKLCPVQLTTLYFLARHLERAHNVKLNRARAKLRYVRNPRKNPIKYRCKFCNQSYVNRSSLVKHLQKHGSDGKLAQRCPCCDRYFETHEEATQHILERHRERVECIVCQKLFTKPDNLARHKRYAHRRKASSKHICPSCGKCCLSATNLSDHERAKCGTEPIYKCEKCEKHYSSYSSLTVHQTVHEKVLPFACGFCGKKFRTKGQLTVHERAHTGERPFRCDVCSRSFPYRESLVTHRTMHTGVTRYDCAECGRKFSCYGNLKKHIQIYHSEMERKVGQWKTGDKSSDDEVC